MSDATTAAGIEAGGQIINSGINALVATNLNKENQEFSREMSDLAYQRTNEMWQRTNDYNTPEARMQRLQAAGLNPHLMYGTGATGGGTTQPGTPAQAKYQGVMPKMDVVGNMMRTYNDMRFKNQQIELMKQQKLNMLQDNIGKQLSNRMKTIDASKHSEIKKYQLQGLDANIRKTEQQILNLTAQEERATFKENYDSWRRGFIQENKYAPDSAPTQWKAVYDIYHGLPKWLQEQSNR